MNVPKTPVSILQEMMVKKGTAPSYELIHNGGGSHQNTFTYQVSCDGLTANGTGRCKKDAKHEAATAMLAAIAKHNALPQLPASPCASPVRTPLPMTLPVCPKSPANVPFRNTIGELQDLCSINNLEDPVYEETGDVGPPHARVFTVQCTVSTFVEVGTATTKKQAKHEAARKMRSRIAGVVSEDQLSHYTNENKKKEEMASKLAVAKYPELSNNYNAEILKSKNNWGLKMINFHKKFKESFDEENQKIMLEKLENLSTLVTDCYKNNMGLEEFTKLKENFENTLESMDVQCQSYKFKSTKKSIFLVGIQLNTAPDIVEVGQGKSENEAKLRAVEKIIESLKFLLS